MRNLKLSGYEVNNIRFTARQRLEHFGQVYMQVTAQTSWGEKIFGSMKTETAAQKNISRIFISLETSDVARIEAVIRGDYEVFDKLETNYNLNLDWLVTGIGDPIRTIDANGQEDDYQTLIRMNADHVIYKEVCRILCKRFPQEREDYQVVLYWLFTGVTEITYLYLINQVNTTKESNFLLESKFSDLVRDDTFYFHNFDASYISKFNSVVKMHEENNTKASFKIAYQGESVTFFGSIQRSMGYEKLLYTHRNILDIERCMIEPETPGWFDKQYRYAFMFMHIKIILRLWLYDLPATSYMSAEDYKFRRKNAKDLLLPQANKRLIMSQGLSLIDVKGVKANGAAWIDDPAAIARESDFITECNGSKDTIYVHVRYCFQELYREAVGKFKAKKSLAMGEVLRNILLTYVSVEYAYITNYGTGIDFHQDCDKLCRYEVLEKEFKRIFEP